MFLHRRLHVLGLAADAPDADFAFHASRDDLVAVARACDGGDSVDVGVVDDVHELAGLRIEGSDLAVAPARDDGLAVSHESDAVALHGRHLDTQDLVAVVGVPDADVVHGTGREYVRVVVGEHDVVYLVVVARVTQLRGQSARIDPVYIAQRSAAEEVSVVCSQCYRADSAENLRSS